ncbi:DUF4180 domain-containing protein [Actinacidiphila sp. bgisy167]|uniref:DUF4180 domain-containing protein n=1 Tax=Actinacidiphila sp. bgisy167 TaxID=3413797 RepID=UPI003D7380E2
MADVVTERRGVPVLVCGEDGARVSGVQDALDLIGATYLQAEVVALPVARLDESFFALRSGLAGEIMQKFVNYRVRLAVVGDVSAYTAASTAFRDLVRECNRGGRTWFVDDLEALDARLG